MINIKDIKERLAVNPEPLEVKELRNKLLTAFKDLEFIEDGHQYILHNQEEGDITGIPSASAIIHRFVPESDWDEIAERYALKHDMEADVVKRLWYENNIKSTNNGTSTHLYGENLHQLIMEGDEDNISPILKPQYENGYLIPYSPKQDAIEKYWEDMFKINELYPLLPECKMYMPKNNIFGINELFCGTGDTLFAYKQNDEWCLILADYKTNKSLINDFNRQKKIRMLAPFDNMIDEPLSHYTIQLTLYSLMLENLGIKVINRRLIWLKNDGEYEKITLPYIKELVIDSFKK